MSHKDTVPNDNAIEKDFIQNEHMNGNKEIVIQDNDKNVMEDKHLINTDSLEEIRQNDKDIALVIETLHVMHDDEITDENGVSKGDEIKKLDGEDKEETEGEVIEEEDEEEEENTDEDDDDEEDGEPPKLIYQRLNGLPPNFFNRDPISACNFHESVFIFATHSGIIHITKPDFTTIRTFKAHRASILSIYTDGHYFATGSMDGTVVIGSLTDEKDIIAYDFKRPIHAVVLETNYAKSRSFVSGGMSGKVLYSSKNWLGQRADLVLDENNGPIVCIQQMDDLLLWMNDIGIVIYQISRKQKILTIDKPKDSPRSDIYWPRVHFPETDRILIAWANRIWSLRISVGKSNDVNEPSSSSKSRILPSTASISFRMVQEKKVKIEHIFKVDDFVSGIAGFKDDLIMILTYIPPERDEATNKLTFNNPDLKLVNSITGQVEFEEEIGLKNIENLGLNDFSLGSHIDLNRTRYFIMSAKDGVIAQELQLNDRLDWFVGKEKYLEAWEISKHLSLLQTKKLNLGILHVDNLIKLGEWKKAASFLSSLLYLDINEMPDGDTKSTIFTSLSQNLTSEDHDSLVKEIIIQWQNWANIFIKSNHIDLLTDVIPKSPKLNIDAKIYNQILQYWILHIDSDDTFFRLVDEWPIDLYDTKSIESFIEGNLENTPNPKLRKCLANLYVKSFDFKKAVPHMVSLKDPNIVQFLSSNHMLDSFSNDIPKFISLRFESNELETLPIDKLENRLDDIIDVLVENRHEIPSEQIIQMMSKYHLDFMSYFYLERLTAIDPFLTKQFSDEQVELYSRYDSGKLLPFLSKSSTYDIDKAIQICEENNYTEELVYLLGKIGENKKALTLIMDELDDPEKAIKFAKHQNDKEVWNMLLNYSTKKPAFIKALIECADDQSKSFYDPVSIIRSMPDDVEIEGLKKSVTKISNNNDLNILLNQLILGILYSQSEDVSNYFRSDKLKGLEIDVNSKSVYHLVSKFQTILIMSLTDKDRINLVSESEFFKDNNRVVFNTKSYTDLDEKLKHIAHLKRHLAHQS
ncbi:uncharacterized protein AC631_03531 [Debaryomyces fabryi]|uniref:Vacuolar protein sorting-associated protein 41 n=1 Tax=Debaryomyces fabryi TaxID=58627 RepID=A0A0V1PWS6_9ASCO|nr:uncharacterized protein AC631_03531 [Debaryomyces fabryi]KSA00712.1 hypothetical protein AC631_03531 [Debaryomyces fabryi]CUM52096.1 unnamed protein product [Debaryomyces fabryi]